MLHLQAHKEHKLFSSSVWPVFRPSFQMQGIALIFEFVSKHFMDNSDLIRVMHIALKCRIVIS